MFERLWDDWRRIDPQARRTATRLRAAAPSLAAVVDEGARLLEMTGDNPENLTMSLSCRDVLAAGQRAVVVDGPFPDLEDEIIRSHDGFW